MKNLEVAVRTSGHLSEAERTEWLGLLPFMNSKQLSELAEILQETDLVRAPAGEPPAPSPVPIVVVPAAVSEPPAPVSKPAIIPRSVPVVQQPAIDSSGVTASVAAPETPVAAAAASTPISAADKLVAKMAARQQQTALPADQQPTEAGLSALGEDTAGGDPSSPATPAASAEEVLINEVKTLEDIRLLNAATLRARGTVAIEEELGVLSKKYGYFSVLFALENSPLFQTYLAVGERALQGDNSLEAAGAALAASNRPYLGRPEFEEVSDLLQKLKNG